MGFFTVFMIAFAVSYVGSIPPGSINITVMQLSIAGYRRAALFFAIGAVLVEFIYAAGTVAFQQFISIHEETYQYLQAVTAIGLIVLGIINLMTKAQEPQSAKIIVTRRVGFLRGVILGIVNPLTIPFWLGMTTYLQSNGWISVERDLFWAYTVGLALGTLTLLISVEFLGSKFQRIARNQFLVFKMPGLIFLIMGGYYGYLLLVSTY